jgi:hypothetical protein
VQVRLITDLLPFLLPGIQKEFPHRGVAFEIAATAVPHTSFHRHKGMTLHAAFETRVYVLPGSNSNARTTDGAIVDASAAAAEAAASKADNSQSGTAPGGLDSVDPSLGTAGGVQKRSMQTIAASFTQAMWQFLGLKSVHPESEHSGSQRKLLSREGSKSERTQVAHLATNASLVANVAFNRASFSEVSVKYSVVSSRYNVTASHWDTMVKYVLGQAGSSLGLQALYAAFAPGKVQKVLQARDVNTEYLDGWYAVSADVHVDPGAIP